VEYVRTVFNMGRNLLFLPDGSGVFIWLG